MNIQLDLSRHCIETEIRQVYNRSLAAYFESTEGHKVIEEKISLLKQALETLDFGALRGRHPQLAGHSPVRVILGRDKGSEIAIWIHEQKIYP